MTTASRIWRGDIGLYRAAYGFGGIGVAIVLLLADALVSAPTSSIAGWLSYLAGGTGELAFAWISVVATWRAARKGRPAGRPYGPIPVGFAFAFVGIQLALIVAWTGWNGLADLGVLPDPGDTLLRSLTVAIVGNSYGDQLSKTLAIFAK
jgi:hypothetical protein